MKLLIVGVASAFFFVGCGGRAVVDGANGGGAGRNAGDVALNDAGGASSDGPGVSGGSTAETDAVSWSDPTTAPDCAASSDKYQSYADATALSSLLIRRWRRCIAPQIPGEDVGVEFTADGKYYPLTFNAAHEVVRRTGIGYGGTWQYFPVGSIIAAIGSTPITSAWFLFDDAEYTSSPMFTRDPLQMRVLFSPVLGKYVPLTP